MTSRREAIYERIQAYSWAQAEGTLTADQRAQFESLILKDLVGVGPVGNQRKDQGVNGSLVLCEQSYEGVGTASLGD